MNNPLSLLDGTIRFLLLQFELLSFFLQALKLRVALSNVSAESFKLSTSPQINTRQFMGEEGDKMGLTFAPRLYSSAH
jgi:hypothetical protein